MDQATVRGLCALGRLWGAIAFCHPYPGYRDDLDWDGALLHAVPRVLEAASEAAFHRAVDELLDRLGDPNTRRVRAGVGPPARAVFGPGCEPRVRWLDDATALVVMRAASPLAGFAQQEALRDACLEASRGEAVVLDLRLLPSPLDPEGTSLEGGLRVALPVLLSRPVVPLGLRHRYHEGYVAQEDALSGVYTSGFSVRHGLPLAAGSDPGRQHRLVVAVGPHSGALGGILGGLRAAGLAALVCEDAPGGAATTDIRRVQLDARTSVDIATGEWVGTDGAIGYLPDVVVAAGDHGDPSDDPALRAAVALARGPWPPQRRRVAAGARPWGGVRLRAPAYEAAPYPPLAHRLLALFRLWSVVERFFPYHALTDRPWTRALEDFIPTFAAARDAVAYGLAVAEMAARLDDSHVQVFSAALNRHLGTGGPDLGVRLVGGRTLVTHVGDASARARGLQAGDTLLAVDGIDIAERRAAVRRWQSGSTPQALERRVDGLILRGDPGSEVRLRFETPDGVIDVALPRRTESAAGPPPISPPVAVLPSGFGYVDLSRVPAEAVDDAMEAVRGTPAAIFDLRRYPLGGAFALAGRICRAPTSWGVFRCPVVSGRDLAPQQDLGGVRQCERSGWRTWDVRVAPRGPWQYAGALVGLIGPDTVSQGEYTAMLLAAAGATFVGGPTAGVNGDVTATRLPGAVRVTFTGMASLWPDGRLLQRAGIEPDLRVEPSPQGLRAGRDEVLEAAEAWFARRVAPTE